jgi:4-hydroxy-tetrahydrodipicolinate reductase
MKLAIAGASGRMGRMLIEAALAAPDMAIGAALDRAGAPGMGRDCSEFLGRTSGVVVTDDLNRIAGCEVLIDFTRPEGTLEHLTACSRHGVKAVIGTTGIDDAGRAAIRAAAERFAIVFAPNMNAGVNAAFKLIEIAAGMLGEDWDVEIIESHHKHKVDAPSGTALKMGEVIARARGRKFSDVAVLSREGQTGERKSGTIGFAAIRGGDIVGEHTALFCGPGERLEITHRSSSRDGYAAGSLRAARFLAGRTTGLFNMFDVLGLND